MPPIPIHKNDPIQPTTASNPDGTTPSTTTNPAPTRTVPANLPATTTTNPSDPPPPQPGARPIAPTPSSYQPQPSQGSANPAPPQPGYTAVHTTTETRYSGPPPQFNIPPPTDAQLSSSRGTNSDNPSTTPSRPGPTLLDTGAAPAAYSPFQNEHQGGAVESGDGAQRRSLEHPPGYVQAPDNAPYSGGGLQGGGLNPGNEADGSVGGAAWSMLSKAGEALKKGEEAAWRAMRN